MHVIRPTLPIRAAAALAATALTAGGIIAATSVASAAPQPKPASTSSPQPKPHATSSAKSKPKPHATSGTKLSISNRVVAHGKHHVDAVTGVLSSDAKGVAGETVALEARMGVKPRWKVVATGMTGTTGTITFDVTPTAKTQFKYVFAGDSTYRASHSNVITVSPVK